MTFVAAAVSPACAPTPRQAVEERPAVAAATATADLTELTSPFEAGGVVRARATALVASRVMAPITAVHVRAGDRVRRGATLVTLDARDINANRARADASSLAAAETVRAAEGDVTAAESAVQLARLTRDRMASLQATRSATTQELDQAVAALETAEAQRASARARLAAATAARDAARAGADAATITTTYAVLAAPFDGIVTERNAEPGSMAAPGVPLLTVEDAAAYRLEVQIDEARASRIAPGQRVDVRLDTGDPAAWRDGRVAEIARVDPASHSFLVKIDLPGGGEARSGLFGRARFAGPPRRALTVPASALVKRGQLTFVFLADADRRARLRPVSIGAAPGDRAEILAGLRQGDTVVVNPPPALADGTPLGGARP